MTASMFSVSLFFLLTTCFLFVCFIFAMFQKNKTRHGLIHVQYRCLSFSVGQQVCTPNSDNLDTTIDIKFGCTATS